MSVVTSACAPIHYYMSLQVATGTNIMTVHQIEGLPTWAPDEQYFMVRCYPDGESGAMVEHIYDSAAGSLLWASPPGLHIRRVVFAPSSRTFLVEGVQQAELTTAVDVSILAWTKE